MKLSKKGSKASYIIGLVTASLSIITIISAMLLSIPVANAETTTSNASINVSQACTLSSAAGTGGTPTADGYSYSKTVTPGNTITIDATILTATCNGPGNYSLYAIGYSGDSYDTPTNTQMLGAGTSAGINISTGTATSGSTSNWAFKLSAVGSDPAPTIISPYNNFANVPGADFAKVATMLGTTGLASTSKVQTKYQVYASSSQAAGSYTGKVKYAMVYPNDAPAPIAAPEMQNLAANKCTTTPITVEDSRDGEQYLVQRLADGKCWMLDNLRLDLGNSTVLNNTTESNTNASTTTLNYLKNGGGRTSDRYPTAKINNVSWTSSSQNYYSIPMTISTYKDQTITSYGEGSGKIGVYYNFCAASAGNYCFGNGTSAGSPSGDATEDICPKGWRMPTGGSSGEYQALYTAYSSDQATFKNALSTPLSGSFSSGSTFRPGTLGYFWSSTHYNYMNMHILVVSSSGVLPSDYSTSVLGASVRCLLSS